MLSLIKRDPIFGTGPSRALQSQYAAPAVHMSSKKLVEMLPMLYHARFDPNTTVRPVMRALWDTLLDAHFPETLHGDILSAIGLDLSTPRTGEATDSDRQAPRRDPRFRERVLRAYEYRCCVCGFDLRIGNITAGLEAAHIKWFQAKGPDIEANGLALCALHHKVFDLGAFTILPDTYSMVFSQHAVSGEASRKMLLGFHGAGIILPQSKDYFPRTEFLHWHEKEVFKKPGRPQA